MNHIEGLNDAQKTAVLHKDGPLLIVAGAGAGKTKVLVHRILNLIQEGVPPHEILAVTFTNKASAEMRERVHELIYADRETNLPVSKYALKESLPFVSTFHSLGVHIIKEHAGKLGLTRNFTIYDRADSMRAIKEAMKVRGIDSKQFEPKRILSIISKQKGSGITEASYRESAGNDYIKKTASSVWELYEQALKKENALDFDDLLLKSVFLLESDESILKHYNTVWKYLMVDEYQDTNAIQFRISELLAGEQNNIAVVGDIDQNIYSWRGALIENLMSFEETFPHTKVVILEENYRSTQTIIDASNTIIEKNNNRIEKKLFTKSPKGEQISVFGGYDEEAEAHFIVTKACELQTEGVPLREIAVLYRTNFQSRVLEEAFLYAGVPYQVLGTRFFERKEVKDVLSFLRASCNELSAVDLKRIVNVPPRGIGKVTLFKMLEGREHELTPAMKKRVDDFRELLKNIEDTSRTQKPSETIKYIIKATGIEDTLKKGAEDDKERLENLYELVTLATKYDGLSPEEGVEKLIEDAALATDQDSLTKNTDAVKLMTIHASKGLEFDVVFITGLEEGLFPQHIEEVGRDEEEERRLFYVALTRARKKVFLTFASTRTIFGSKEVQIPSEFVSEIPQEYLEEYDGEENQTRRDTEEFLILD